MLGGRGGVAMVVGVGGFLGNCGWTEGSVDGAEEEKRKKIHPKIQAGFFVCEYQVECQPLWFGHIYVNFGPKIMIRHVLESSFHALSIKK